MYKQLIFTIGPTVAMYESQSCINQLRSLDHIITCITDKLQWHHKFLPRELCQRGICCHRVSVCPSVSPSVWHNKVRVLQDG